MFTNLQTVKVDWTNSALSTCQVNIYLARFWLSMRWLI